ncbi:polysaccharide biosynthesis/export family protein [Myxacorys almedinensis]|uniref:Sugar ABC transporter substrate-binding protein n=1 Tax=Myxacorys almedinensis A TaxID=2690445 RepID=A0A8J7Z222_9CYAN|nr:polysaccharide biosynthesis/export family protein [Myxacorys almedinensis]NDJ16741.1 sugar ABC transporter substrate-binding protein [Myxacorys almedinensis A]
MIELSAVRKVSLKGSTAKFSGSWMVAMVLGLTGVAAPAIAQTAPPGSGALPPSNIPAPISAPASAPVVDQSYLLGAGDKIKLDVFGVPEYSGEYQVLADGSLNLPLAGSVRVGGLTLRQASSAIESRYQEWLTRPVVTVSLMSSRPVQIAVSGEVTRPGAYATSLAEAGAPTLTKMLQLAGGLTQSADIQRVQILRRLPGTNAGTTPITVNLQALLKSGDLSQDIQLRDGDSILVPAAAATTAMGNDFAGTTLESSNNEPIDIIVAGEVNRPGPHSVVGEQVPVGDAAANGQTAVAAKVKAPTVTRAIQIAGGITERADIRDIEVKRTARDGSEQSIKVNLMNLLKAGDAKQDVRLQQGDRIVIPTAVALSPEDAATVSRASFSPDSITVNVVGEVGKPGQIQVPPNTPMNQAILAAGGFVTSSRKSRVEFLRLQPNGTVDRRQLAVDFKQGINSANNPALRNNDTIVVGKNGLATLGGVLGTVLNPLGSVFGIFNLFR